MMRSGVEGKVALVSGGGGQGIGGAISRMLGEAGARVVVFDLNRERAEEAVRDIEAAGGDAVALTGDAMRADDVARAVAGAREAFGGVDILVNVVGGSAPYGVWRPMAEWTEEQWNGVIAMNLGTVFLMCREVIRLMREQGRGGSIVNIASISGTVAAPYHSAYGAAKAGILNLTRSLALEYAHSGIRVNAVSPGSIQTPAADTSPERQEAHRQAVPLGRMGRPEEIAGAVLFLASDLSSYVTGHELLVDGGARARLPVPLGNRRTHTAG
jgi:NAD(P)-dependent dehydrogenase (short-subunit alcohol dehydrogenase family)